LNKTQNTYPGKMQDL